MADPNPTRRGPGRPPKDPTAGATRKVSTWLTPAEIAWLEGRYGTVYTGLRSLVARDVAGGAKKSRAKIV